MIELKTPTLELLPRYVDALRRGWTPDHIVGVSATQEQLAAIEQDAARFVARQTDLGAVGGPVTLPDGSKLARIPGRKFWIWDGDLCGRLSLRWQPGNAALPPHVLGHIGYAVVPWKRAQGHATQAVRAVLPYARVQGLPYLEVTTDPDNFALQKVDTANGGVLLEAFTKPAAFDSAPGLRFRISLSSRRLRECATRSSPPTTPSPSSGPVTRWPPRVSSASARRMNCWRRSRHVSSRAASRAT